MLDLSAACGLVADALLAVLSYLCSLLRDIRGNCFACCYGLMSAFAIG